MVAVHRSFLRIERTVDLRSSAQVLAHRSHRSSRGSKQRQRRSCPGEDAHFDSFGELGQKVPKNRCLSVARQRELGSEVPAGDVDVRLGLLQLRHHLGQGFGTVDQDLKLTPGARLRVSAGPAAPGSVERSEPADPLEPPPVVRADGATDRRAQPSISAEGEIASQGSGSTHASRIYCQACGPDRPCGP
jgi:hypothetical protein